MNALAKREGRYLHADGYSKDLTFGEGRTFRVVVAGAYDAGIIGPEHNGIVVLDLDNSAVDQAKPDVPDEVALVMKAVNGASNGSLGGKDILPAELVALHGDANSGYAFPDRTRLDMVAAIAGHSVHSERFGKARLAWNIKTYGFDTSGKSEGFSPDPAYDELWNACVEKDEYLFQQAADDALSPYVDGDMTSALGEDSRGKFKFATEGRSGGWLVLDKFDGSDLSWSNRHDMVEGLLEMNEKDLVELYAGVRTFDATIDANREMAFQFSSIRQSKEEEWKADPSDAVDLAERLQLRDWAPPSQATPTP